MIWEASLTDRGRGYGFTVHETDGTDFMATLETFRTAVNNAREGRGPQWVLAKTLRMCGHGEHDDASYIPRELKEEYEKKDPVAVAERQLLAAGWLTPEETVALKKQYADEVQLAVATAQREPEPDPFREDWNATVWRPY
ncbi:MAG: thiamine pyrophosphate-dependent enzyme [Akkermansia sp.]